MKLAAITLILCALLALCPLCAHAEAVPDELLHEALLSTAFEYKRVECWAEGHHILGTRREGDAVEVYLAASVGGYGFMGGGFVMQSGWGGPCTAVLSNAGGEWSLVELKEIEDYSEIPNIMPKDMEEALFAYKDDGDIRRQMNAQVQAYLDGIGRDEPILDYSDINAPLSGMLTCASNFCMIIEDNYPLGVTTIECLEDGERYLYTKAWTPDADGVTNPTYTTPEHGSLSMTGTTGTETLSKTRKSDGALVESITIRAEEYRMIITFEDAGGRNIYTFDFDGWEYHKPAVSREGNCGMDTSALDKAAAQLIGETQQYKGAGGEALQALQAAHPGYAVTAHDRWGDTAAAALSKDGENILCVAEKQNGAWVVTIDNPKALLQGEQTPFMLLDTDAALFWNYRNGNGRAEYSSIRQNGEWGEVSYRYFGSYGDRYVESIVDFGDFNQCKVLMMRNRYEDENENLLYETADIPIPAEWLSDYIKLADFDVSKFPGYGTYSHDRANEYVRRGAAEYLIPAYEYCGGTIEADSMQFMMRRPDGSLVLMGVQFNESDGWTLTESTPLPEGTQYGHENLTSSLYINDTVLANVSRFFDGSWGVSFINAASQGSKNHEDFSLGQGWVACLSSSGDKLYFGNHPWDDITTIDWTTLPTDTAEALEGLDTSGMAVVNNPNPADRLHLRIAPDKDAQSLGKYYNGTAVRVLADEGEWVKVSVYGIEGYMMREYLALGDAMNTVDNAMPQLQLNAETVNICKATDDLTAIAVVKRGAEFTRLNVLGVVGDSWYHIWYADLGLSGYVRQQSLYPGNG